MKPLLVAAGVYLAVAALGHARERTGSVRLSAGLLVQAAGPGRVQVGDAPR